MMKCAKFIKITSTVVLFILLFGIVYGMFFYIKNTKDLSLDHSALTNTYSIAEIYDSNNEPITYTNDSSYIEFSDISTNIINAFVALEDKRFYTHNGIDYIRTVGALINNIKVGYSEQGGSTITQQLAKNSMLSNEKTYVRKIQEWKLAKELEESYTKEEIIEMYLNIIYFGNGIYGIDDACKSIFDKSPSELNIAESAMLAGIVKNPRDNSPLSEPQNATERMKVVLNVMHKENYINDNELETALKYEYIAPASNGIEAIISDYGNVVLEEAATILGITEFELVSNNYKIYTYCDKNLQEYLANLSENQSLQTDCDADIMAIVVDNASGAVLGYTSSSHYSATTLKRQPASTIKPILTYAPALDMGYVHPASPVNDEKVTIDGYSPQNYANSYLGWTDLRSAVMSSSNAVALSLTDEIGLSLCKKYAEGFGLSFNSNDKLATALGGMTDGVTLMELSESYLTLANGGTHSTISFISHIIDADGKVIYTNTPDYNYVISEESAYLLTDMLIDNAKYGTAKKLNSLDFDIACKTGTAGTSSGNTDAFCMSYTANNTVAVWYGNNLQSGSLMDTAITGGSYPTLFTKYIYSYLGCDKDFSIPNGIITQNIDTFATEKDKTLTLASSSTPTEYQKEVEIDITMINSIPVSTVFDNIVPKNIDVISADKTVTFTFDTNDNFIYNLYRIDGKTDILIDTLDNKNKHNLVDNDPKIGINSYYLTVETPDGMISCKSNIYHKFLFSAHKKSTRSSA